MKAHLFFDEVITNRLRESVKNIDENTLIIIANKDVYYNLISEFTTQKFELIDKFIASKPKIQPVKKDAPTYNIAKAQMIQSEALMTETLARIYVEQKNYSKAIQSYKILSLKE